MKTATKKKTKKPPKKKGEVGKDLKLYGQPLDYTFLMGAYMAINAVPGTVILVDGPDCITGKVEHIFGKHDWSSTLLECTGLNRVECSFTDARNTVMCREKAVEKNLSVLAERKDLTALFLSSLPMTFVTGTDYTMILNKVAEDVNKPLYYLLPRSLHAGHLEGYDEMIKTLAEHLKLPEVKTDSNKVAIVGYFMDRNEEDHFGNIREFKRMIEALGLDLSSIWFDGTHHDELHKISEAGTIISLPYGRDGAKMLAERTGAKLLETGLPIGIEGTRKWLLAVADFLGRTKEAEKFIEAELERIIPRLEWVVPHHFLNKRFWVATDPYLIGPLAAFIEELGGRIVGGATVGEQINVRAGRAGGKKDSVTVLPQNVKMALIRPTSGMLEEDLRRVYKEGVDLVVGNTDVILLVPRSVPVIEIGYQSYYYHALHDSPFMGFNGSLVLMDRMMNAMSLLGAHRVKDTEYETGRTIRSG